MMPLASSHRRIGDALIDELAQGLRAGRHFAIVGPRHGAKAWILDLLAERAQSAPDSNRPRVIRLGWRDYDLRGAETFVAGLADRLHLDPDARTSGDARLSGRIGEMFADALAKDPSDLWVLVEDVLGFTKPVARELLAAFRSLHGQLSASGETRRFAAVVTGGSDFTALTIGQNSPYRYSTRLLIVGLDRPFARDFFTERRRRLMGAGADPSVPNEVFDYLYECTEGSAHLLQELVVAPGRYPYPDVGPQGRDFYSDLEDAKRMVDHVVRTIMPEDHYCRAVLREAEQDPDSFDVLLAVLRKQSVRLPKGAPHRLEVCGLLVRGDDGLARFSNPMVERDARHTMTERHIADVYSAQSSWDKAWSAYESVQRSRPELRDRPMSGAAQFALRQSILVWKDQLMDAAQVGVESVVAHFMQGMRYLFLFDRGGLIARSRTTWVDRTTFGCEAIQPPAPPAELFERHRGSPFVQGDQLTLWCAVRATGNLPEWPEPILYLERLEEGREIDTFERALLREAVLRFCQSYAAAEEIEYRARIGKLREKHLKVIEQVTKAVLEDRFNIEHVARRTAEALVSEADCYRVQICLVNAGRDRIQAVASCGEPGALDFTHKTDYDQRNPSDDIQAWVVANKQPAIVPDAETWDDPRFKINKEQSVAIGMKAFAVVPMIRGDSVIGTIHLERHDRKPPQTDEIRLCLLLADYLAGVFRQAQRQELLHGAIEALDDEVRIIDPEARLLYRNRAAADADGAGALAGWQSDVRLCDWNRHTWARNFPTRKEVVRKALMGAPARYFLTPKEGQPPRAQSLEMSAIEDFRAHLLPPFEADGIVGMVEHLRDMTPLYQQLDALNGWLRATTIPEAVRAIINTEFLQEYEWCRVYLRGEDGENGPCLRSLMQRGLDRRSDIQAFENGALVFDGRDDPPPSAWFALERVRRPAVFEVRAARTGTGAFVEAPALEGADRYFARRELERIRIKGARVRRWIEAPLVVGERAIGVVELSLPRSGLNPSKWALFGTFLQTAALALDGLLRADDKAALERRTAEAMIWIFHQFRQPLFESRVRLRLLAREFRTAPESPGADQMARLSAALTAMERISADYQSYIRPYVPGVTPADLVAALRETCAKARAYRDASVSTGEEWVFFEHGPESLVVNTDVAELQRITDELIYNAVKARAPHIRVAVDALSGPAAVQIVVDDDGPGVPEAILDRLFEPDPNKSSGGTGFGLSNVKKHVNTLGGTIVFEARKPHGARFVVRVPVSVHAPQEGDLQ